MALVLVCGCGSAQPQTSAPTVYVGPPPEERTPLVAPALPETHVNVQPLEAVAPKEFPPAQPIELDLSTFVPESVDDAIKQKLAAAEQLFLRGDHAGAAQAYARVPRHVLVDPLLALARLRLRAVREGWPTQLGAGDKDARVAKAIQELKALNLQPLPPGAPRPSVERGGMIGPAHSLSGFPFLRERGRWQLVHGDYEDAWESLNEATRLRGSPGDAEALSLFAFANLATGKVADALPLMEQATMADLGSADRWGNLGTVRMMSGKVNEATRAYEARVRLAQGSAQAHADYGIALVQTGELTRGIAELKTAIDQEPNKPSFLSNYGYALHRAGRRAEAQRAFEQALRGDPKLLVGLLGLSALLAEDPLQRAEARKLLDRAIALAPDDPRVVAAKTDLDALEAKR